MLDVLYNDIEKLGTEEKKEKWMKEQTNKQKKSHFEVAAPPNKGKRRVFPIREELKLDAQIYWSTFCDFTP